MHLHAVTSCLELMTVRTYNMNTLKLSCLLIVTTALYLPSYSRFARMLILLVHQADPWQEVTNLNSLVLSPRSLRRCPIMCCRNGARSLGTENSEEMLLVQGSVKRRHESRCVSTVCYLKHQEAKLHYPAMATM